MRGERRRRKAKGPRPGPAKNRPVRSAVPLRAVPPSQVSPSLPSPKGGAQFDFPGLESKSPAILGCALGLQGRSD